MFNDIGIFIRVGIFALFVLFVILKLLYENFWKPLQQGGKGLAAPQLPREDAEALRRFLEQVRGGGAPSPEPVEVRQEVEPPPLPTPVIVEEASPPERRPRRSKRLAPLEPVTLAPPQPAEHAKSIHEYLEEMAHQASVSAALGGKAERRRATRVPGLNASLRDAILAEVILGKPKALQSPRMRGPSPRCKTSDLR